MTRISFAPLRHDALAFLMASTGIDYRHCRFDQPQWFCVTARDDEGSILGVFIGEFTTWFEVQITCAIRHPRFLTRRLLRAIFTTLFSQAVRITAFVRPDNEPGLRIIRHLGFTYEGFVRLGVEGRWDALLFGMLRQECRYLGKVPPSHFGSNGSDVTSRDIETVREHGIRSSRHADDDDIGNSQLGIGINANVPGQAVPAFKSNCDVLAFGLPNEMPGIDAAKMAVVTEMSGFSFGEWSRAVGFFANKTSDEIGPAIQPEDGVASLVSGIWPEEATIITETGDRLTKEPLGLAIEGATSQRIAMPTPAIPMHPAQTLGNDTLGTTSDFATRLRTHQIIMPILTVMVNRE